jgi:hypothetical protein
LALAGRWRHRPQRHLAPPPAPSTAGTFIERRAALEEHDKSPLVDYPRLPAFTIKPRASAIDSHLVRAPSDSRPFWRQPTPLDTAEHRNMRRCRRCDRADWLEPDPKAYVA